MTILTHEEWTSIHNKLFIYKCRFHGCNQPAMVNNESPREPVCEQHWNALYIGHLTPAWKTLMN